MKLEIIEKDRRFSMFAEGGKNSRIVNTDATVVDVESGVCFWLNESQLVSYYTVPNSFGGDVCAIFRSVYVVGEHGICWDVPVYSENVSFSAEQDGKPYQKITGSFPWSEVM